MPVAPGDVVRLFLHVTKPPKIKRCVVACLEPSPILLLINSEINALLLKNEELRALQVLIDTANHDFMSRDSWIDCSQQFGYPVEWLRREIQNDPRQLLGTISETTRREIIACVTNSRILSPKKKCQIIDGLTSQGDEADE